MTDALEDHRCTVSIGGRTITNLHFADDINSLAGGAEEQAGFRVGRSTTEQIFNLRILCEKYLQHQQDLYHAFIDFKKAFNKVWHAALWATMKKYNISTNLIQVSKTSITGLLVPSSSTAA